jgi:hypothetical protein
VLVRLAIVFYVFAAFLGVGVDNLQVALQHEDRLTVELASDHDAVQSDGDGDSSDDELVDVDCDEDYLPGVSQSFTLGAAPTGKLPLLSERAPESAPRESLFRPPRTLSA